MHSAKLARLASRQAAARAGRGMDADPTPERQRAATSRPPGPAPSMRRALAVRTAVWAAAVAAYVILTSTALTQLLAGSATPRSGQGLSGSGAPARSEPRNLEAAAAGMPPTTRAGTGAGVPSVLTITVNGPAGTFDVYCATTTDRAPFDRLLASPDDAVDSYHRWCAPARWE